MAILIKLLRDLKEREPDKVRQETMTRVVLYVVGGSSLVFSVLSGVLLYSNLIPHDSFFLFSVLMLISAIALFTAFAGFWRQAGYLFPFAIYSIAVYGNFIGGIEAPAVLMYVVTVIMIGMLHGYRRMGIAFIVCIATYLTLAYLFYVDIITPSRYGRDIFVNRVLITFASLTAIGLLVWIMGLRYRLEISERAKAEERVNIQNEELKSMVEQLQTANLRIRESENKFFEIFHLSPVPMTLNELASGKYVEINGAVISATGFSREEMLGKTPLKLGIFSKDEVDRFNEIIGLKGSIRNHEVVLHARDGRYGTFLLNVEVTEIDGEPIIITSAIDITEKKLAEEKILKTHRLESLGLIAGGLAHDFNNILMGIMGNLSLLKLEINSEGAAESYLNNSLDACKRAQGLTRQLLTFSKGGAPIKSVIDIVPVLKREVQFNLSGSRIKPVYIFSDAPLLLEVDEAQIGQVVNNLVLNAVQAMPPGGSITVNLEQKYLNSESDFHPSFEPPQPGNYVVFSIADSGSGIDDKSINRIFDPYYTTRKEGTGLGLSVVYSIVRNHGGYLNVVSKPGVGSTFSVYLPSYSGDAALYEDSVDLSGKILNEAEDDFKSTGIRTAANHLMNKRVLVMDDEKSILTVMRGMLTHLGYETVTAINGSEAVELFKKAIDEQNPFGYVILDLTIPGGYGGREVIGALRSMDPSVKAIVSSGYSDDPVFGDHTSYGFSGLLKKPFTIDELKSVLSRIIK